MVFCRNCEENVKPKTYFSWSGFIRGLGFFYLMYVITKIPQCPNCNFPMPRRSLVLAIQPPQYLVKLAEMSVLQLTRFRDKVVSASRGSYLNRKSYPSQYLASMKTHQIISLNMMTNEVHSSISLESNVFKK
jgi:hypothetical protein